MTLRGPLLFIACSIAAHTAAVGWLGSGERAPAPTPAPGIELVMVEVPAPAPPAVAGTAAPPAAEPPPRRRLPVATLPRATVHEDLPPPPNDAPLPLPGPPPVLVVGVSMSSTTTAGTFSAPVGNTAYGRTAGVATAPSQVRAYAAARYVPPDQVDADPELISDVKVYPEAARREGIEGSVLLALLIDPAGRVIDAQVLRSLGRGLDEAAMGAARQFRFKPAMRSGEAVSTRIQYSYTFVLN